MTKYLHIEDVQKEGMIGKEVALRGWAYRTRGSSSMRFVILRDSTGIIQCTTIQKEVDEKTWKSAEKLYVESSFTVKGIVRKDDRAPGGYELTVKELEPICIGEPFPISKDLSQEFLLDIRHLSLRSRKLTAVMKVRSAVFGAIHEYFRKQEFYEMHSPILLGGVAESGPDLFEVDYFGKKVFLTQTWQLYAEAMMASLEKIYTITPAFRAEKSRTIRHLAEYWTAEAEAAWYDLDDCIELSEKLIEYVCIKIAKDCKKELKELGRDPKDLEKIKTPFPRITYTEALKKLEKEGMKVEWGKDLRTLEERKIMEHYDKPLIVTHYPKDIMAFYKPKDPKDPKVALCYDMLCPELGIEIIGGSERELDIKELEKALIKAKEDPKEYKFYFDTRKYGAVPHSGFGLGIERIIMWICKLDDIKDAIPFPRTMTRIKP